MDETIEIEAPPTLLEVIDDIEAGDKVSEYQGKVSDLITKIEKYREPFKNKPDWWTYE